MRENHIFMMYYLEILLSFVDYHALHPGAQKLILSTRFLLYALHLTKGFSNEVYVFTLRFYVLYTHIILWIFHPFCLHILYLLKCIFLSPVYNSPYQKNASKLQKKTYGCSYIRSRLLLVMNACHQRRILCLTCSMTVMHTNAIWKHSLHTHLKISRSSGNASSNREICHWCKLGKLKYIVLDQFYFKYFTHIILNIQWNQLCIL